MAMTMVVENRNGKAELNDVVFFANCFRILFHSIISKMLSWLLLVG